MLGTLYGYNLIINPDETTNFFPPINRESIIKPNYFMKPDGTLAKSSKLCTLSAYTNVYDTWQSYIDKIKETNNGCEVQLYTTIDTTDIHPDIIRLIKKEITKVIVPSKYMKSILDKHEINSEYTNWYSRGYLYANSDYIPKQINKKEIIFYYNGLNSPITNLNNMVEVFDTALKGTDHFLILRTNFFGNLLESPNIKYSDESVSAKNAANIYNLCDYVVSFSRTAGLNRDILEAKSFNKPIIAHDKGAFAELKLKHDKWITLPSSEEPVECDIPASDILSNDADFDYKKAYYGKWWEIDCEVAIEIIKNLVKT